MPAPAEEVAMLMPMDTLCFELLEGLRERPPGEHEAAAQPSSRLSAIVVALAGLLLSLLLLAAALVPAQAEETVQELRIGYQKSGTLAVLRQKPELAQRLARRRIMIDWVEFQAGPPLLEALNAGSIDFGCTGDTPPIFAQATGARLVYVGYLANPGRNIALIVRKDAPIATVRDLRGKRIAFTQGSSAHYFLVKALAAAGLSDRDITPVYLEPADAAAAFRAGSVAAWAIRDPFYAQAERATPVRVLTTAAGLAPSSAFFLARRDYVQHHPDIIADLVQDLDDASHWSETHQDAVAEILSAFTGVELGAEQAIVARANYGVSFLTPKVIAEQQSIADSFHRLGLIPVAIDVDKAVWMPPRVAAMVQR
jgi:sulfonate transport system substrate-binding protein